MGVISYGAYLFHMVIFAAVDACWRWLFGTSASEATDLFSMMLRFSVGVTLTIVLAYLSRWHFEERFLQLKNRFDFGPRLGTAREETLSPAETASRALETA